MKSTPGVALSSDQPEIDETVCTTAQKKKRQVSVVAITKVDHRHSKETEAASNHQQTESTSNTPKKKASN